MCIKWTRDGRSLVESNLYFSYPNLSCPKKNYIVGQIDSKDTYTVLTKSIMLYNWGSHFALSVSMSVGLSVC